MRNYRSGFLKGLARGHLAVGRAVVCMSSDSFSGTLSTPWYCPLDT